VKPVGVFRVECFATLCVPADLVRNPDASDSVRQSLTYKH